jgi:hypothetical protein
MKQLLLAIALMASLPAFAQTPASEASIRELLKVTEARKLLDGAYAQMDGLMDQAMKQAMGDTKPTPEQEKVMAEFRHKAVDLIQDEMGWQKLEPLYVDLYAKTFSQSEIDGILTFYKTEAGKAMIAKMPTLMNNLMQMMMKQMQSFMPRLQQLQQEYAPKIKAAGGK